MALRQFSDSEKLIGESFGKTTDEQLSQLFPSTEPTTTVDPAAPTPPVEPPKEEKPASPVAAKITELKAIVDKIEDKTAKKEGDDLVARLEELGKAMTDVDAFIAKNSASLANPVAKA